MSECQMCHAEDSSVLELGFGGVFEINSLHQVTFVCQDCYDEMKGESDAAGQDFNEYWENDDE